MSAKRKKSPVLWYLFGAIIILIVLVLVFRKKSNGTEVETEKPKMRDIVEMVSASGKIYPEVEVVIIPELAGEIIKLYIEEGDSVQKGTELVKINPDIYEDILERAKAAVYTSEANLGNAKARAEQSKAQLHRAKLDYNRNKKLYEDKVISTSEYEIAETQYNVAKAELSAANESINAAIYSVKSAEASLQEATNNLNKTMVYSPMSGIVTALNVEEGKVVGGISTFSATEMMRISNLNQMEARVDVSENDILRISIGDTVIIDVEAYDEKEFKGIVTQISSSANSQMSLSSDQATNFTVKINILKESYKDLVDRKKGKYPFLPGMSTSVEIITENLNDVITIPIEAVTTRLPSDLADSTVSAKDKKDEELIETVFLIEGEEVKPVEVETGIQDDKYIVITKGIELDHEVVTGPYSTVQRLLKKGDKVTVKSSSSNKKDD